MQKLLIVAAMLVATATSAYGLKCYTCNSKGPTGNVNCNDPLNITYANASFMPNVECPNPTNLPGLGCIKKYTGIPNANGTVRDCGFVDANAIMPCQTDTTNGITATSCYCSTEYCNSAISTNSVLSSVKILASFALLMRAAY